MDTLNYKLLKNFLSKDLCLYLSSFCFRFINNIPIASDVPNTRSFHSQSSEIFSNIMHYLKPYVENETKLKLKPIYTFNRIYYGGSSLVPHKDRSSCEISLTITLDYKYSDKNYEWPFFVDQEEYVLDIGDAVLYKGREYEHWRYPLDQPETDWHHQLFIHYVDLNGPFKFLQEEFNNEIIRKKRELLKTMND